MPHHKELHQQPRLPGLIKMPWWPKGTKARCLRLQRLAGMATGWPQTWEWDPALHPLPSPPAPAHQLVVVVEVPAVQAALLLRGAALDLHGHALASAGLLHSLMAGRKGDEQIGTMRNMVDSSHVSGPSAFSQASCKMTQVGNAGVRTGRKEWWQAGAKLGHGG